MIFSGLNGYVWFARNFGQLFPFQLHRQFDTILSVFVIIHFIVGLKFYLIRKRIRFSRQDLYVTALAASLIIGLIYIDLPVETFGNPSSSGGYALVQVGDFQYRFNSSEVQTIRPDIFKPGHFSAFDVLVHLSEKGFFDLQYHFDATMNTHVIDSLNGTGKWWYIIYYSGGWSEKNVFRMDHYPWKEGTTLIFYEEIKILHSTIYQIFREEVERRTQNGGSIIIPEVIINSHSFSKVFYDVNVTPHNLRNDSFQEGVITAIDVILSLGDQGNITYGLQWYDSIGTADYVRSYWVEAINGDVAAGTCGFVYESGSHQFPFFSGNHIHLPSDMRVINSPEYVKYFWICI